MDILKVEWLWPCRSFATNLDGGSRSMNCRDVVRILLDHGFALQRQEGSHRQYQGIVDGQRRIVTIAYHQASEDVRKRTLASIIRQSGLPKRLFR